MLKDPVIVNVEFIEDPQENELDMRFTLNYISPVLVINRIEQLKEDRENQLSSYKREMFDFAIEELGNLLHMLELGG